MAFRPALTCYMAWLPVSAPSELTKGSVYSDCHRRVAPRRARVCSTWVEPRRRITSSAE